MDEKEKIIYEDLAKKDKQRYLKEVANRDGKVPAGDGKNKKRKSVTKEESNLI